MANFFFVSSMEMVPWGGSEELWALTALALRRKGHMVAASVHHWPKQARRIEELLQAGVNVRSRRKTVLTRLARISQRLAGWPKEEIMVWQTMRMIRQFEPDLVCISQGGTYDSPHWRRAMRRAKLPYVIVANSNLETWWPADPVVDELLVDYREARRCFFVSRQNKELFEYQLGAQLPNSAITRNPFNVPHQCDLPWPGANGGWKLATVARLDPSSKGHDLILRVLAQEKWRQRDLSLNFFGEGVSERALRRLAERFANPKVKFCGHVNDVESVWRDHHALLMPSRHEGLPLALVEAMLCGRTAIVTDVGGNTELVEEGKTGFLVAAPTFGLLDEALERAWRQRDDWQAMGLQAQQRARSVIPANPAEDFADELVRLASGADEKDQTGSRD